MEDAGLKLKRAREKLGLRYRDVEEASQKIADRRKNAEYYVALSRLSDIENRGTVPSIFRLYALCAIYRLEFTQVLDWYGVRLAEIPADASIVEVASTHLIDMQARSEGDLSVPLALNVGADLRKTFFLNRYVREWGKLPLQMLAALDVRHHRYGFIGWDDWSMYPVLAPGSLVQIDEGRKRIAASGWTHEFERPIYFLEHRDGYDCCWCSFDEGRLILQPHPSSHVPGRSFRYPDDIEVIGQVVGAAMRLDLGKRHHTRS